MSVAFEPTISSLPAAARVATAQSSLAKDVAMLTRPRIAVMVLATVATGMWLTGGSFSSAVWLSVLVGTGLVAASSSIANQILERQLDRRMPRTADRPLASGRLRSSSACWFAAVTLIALLALLRAGMVEWDGGPWNQMAGVVAAALVANLIWLAAYAHAPVSRLAPFEYLALPMLLGVGLLFGQSYPLLLLIGFLAVVPICALLALCEILLVYGRDGADA